MTRENMIRRLVIRTIIWLAITGVLLFVAAGTVRWPEAWVFLAEFGVLGLASGIAIGRSDPELLRERMTRPIQRGQKRWDKILLMAVFALWTGQYVVAGLDVRFHASHLPLWLEAAGALAIAVGFGVFHAVMLANTFASPVVKIQSERKHQVVSTGPYAVVRHPMYAGAIPMIVGTALLLGSWYALVWSLAVVAALAVRAVLEEQLLTSELEGYATYAARVRYRLVPGVW